MQRLYCLVEAKQQRDHGRDGVVSDNITRHTSPESVTLRWRRGKFEKDDKYDLDDLKREGTETAPLMKSSIGWDLESTPPELTPHNDDDGSVYLSLEMIFK
ncbi:unnamed protein product [Strongylus vulgaris]|uniref:Uncharacterized protein n=1 Tax=Strongylus vulgaris TaxID=40348 RepID=A0A3P7LXF1_STRVU|nr:unnamed protein product [Strongylus vulgaris]